MTPCGKVLRRHLIEELGIVEIPNSPRPIFDSLVKTRFEEVPAF